MTDRLIVLRDGRTARLVPYLLLARLQSEGFKFKLGDRDDILANPLSRLHSDDRAALQGYMDDVIRLLRYMPSDHNPSRLEPWLTCQQRQRGTAVGLLAIGRNVASRSQNGD